MKKVCVVTFYKRNYGGFLQAYALQKLLIDYGYDAELVNYDYLHDGTLLGVPYKKLNNVFVFAKKLLYRGMIYFPEKRKEAIFQNDIDKNLNQSDYYRTYMEVLKNPPKADIYITGSDQVWNPFMNEQGLMSRFLTFADESKSVICSYAASMGILYLHGKEKDLFKEQLKRFDLISVRESRTIQTLAEVTNKKIHVHRDPTLLLHLDKWDFFLESPNYGLPYIFLYMVQKNDELVKYAVELAKTHVWKIMNLCAFPIDLGELCINRGAVECPARFVGGIKEATYVVTNSFHCLVFSTLFRKRTYVQYSKTGAERLQEMVEWLNLDRLLCPELIEQNQTSEIYKYVDMRIDAEREKFDDYVRQIDEILITKRIAAKKET